MPRRFYKTRALIEFALRSSTVRHATCYHEIFYLLFEMKYFYARSSCVSLNSLCPWFPNK